MNRLSIVLPAKNEAANLKSLIPVIRRLYPDAELIVVNDGSTDNTAELCTDLGAHVITHPYSKGNGAAIKTGARHATGDIIVFMDGDGQHDPNDIARLLQKMSAGYDMVVGARTRESQASAGRSIANRIYNLFSSWMTEQRIEDLTSGFRVVNSKRFREFLHLLPNGFSYPTTSTMAFFRAGYSVGYVPITAGKRLGKSHISLSKDGIRFLIIIFKIGTLYSPLRIFTPISLFFLLNGAGYYLYTFTVFHRFTNMSALLLSVAVVVFLIGLVSEQITSLMYTKQDSTE